MKKKKNRKKMRQITSRPENDWSTCVSDGDEEKDDQKPK